ncbi:MAG: hypothetical protein JJE04_10390 [Acidobacteriia bacterium]|nr:hypothetical protein [Terriglobia bacterium]
MGSVIESGQHSDSAIRFARLHPDEEGGVELANVPAGMMLEVRTKNHTYTIIPQPNGEALIWGHPELCPEPIAVTGIGSSPGGYIVREGYFCPEMRLVFRHLDRPIKTSRILGVRALSRQ